MKSQKGSFDPMLAFIVGLAVLAVVLVAFLVHATSQDARQWAQFKAAHECTIVEKRRGQTHVSTALVPNSQGGVSVTPVVTSTAGQTAWKCNDGVVYWR